MALNKTTLVFSSDESICDEESISTSMENFIDDRSESDLSIYDEKKVISPKNERKRRRIVSISTSSSSSSDDDDFFLQPKRKARCISTDSSSTDTSNKEKELCTIQRKCPYSPCHFNDPSHDTMQHILTPLSFEEWEARNNMYVYDKPCSEYLI